MTDQRLQRYFPFLLGLRVAYRSVASLVLLTLIIMGLPALSGAQICQPNGDVDRNGSVTAADALLAFQQALGLTQLTACQRDIADVTPLPSAPDGNITASDALCIFQKALSLPSCLDTLPSTNQPPVADAGLEQFVSANEVVTLAGSGSDTDGTIVRYRWVQTGGPAVVLSGADTPNASFTAPEVTFENFLEELEFQLTVTDDDGDSGTAIVLVVVLYDLSTNEPPMANAGFDQMVSENTLVTLSGSGNDPDGFIVGYFWFQLDGTPVELFGWDTPNPRFFAPEVDSDEDLVFELTVFDDVLLTPATDTVTITVLNGVSNTPPVADAGRDQTVDENTVVTLDGSASRDSDGTIISYTWSQISNGAASVIIAGADSAQATFQAPEVNTDTVLEFQLRVVDNSGGADTDRVSVTVTNIIEPPILGLLGIAVIGLGESILVTDSETVTINGVSDSDIDIAKVSYQNLTNNTSGDAVGTMEWSAEITLAEGENQLQFSVLATDGSTAAVDTTLTYYPALDFTTSLNLNREIIYQGDQDTEVIATIGTGNVNNPQLSLVRLDDDTSTVVIEALEDDGMLPDEIQGDGIYSGSFSFGGTENGYYCYRVEVSDDQFNDYGSEQQCTWLTDHYSNEQVDKAVTLADESAVSYQAQIDQGATPEEAASAVRDQLEQDNQVGATGATEDGGIWWVSDAGILGLYHPVFDGQKAAGSGSQYQENSTSMPSSSSRQSISNYPLSYLSDRSEYVPNRPNEGPVVAQQSVDPGSGDKNRVQSTKALILTPYLHQFGTFDEYNGVWQTIKKSQSCTLVAEKEAVNSAVSLEDFKGWGTFGYIVISSHGDNYYRGLSSLWQDVWGPNDFLLGSLSLVGISTGIGLTKNADGDWEYGVYENDVKAKRLAVSSGGTLVILPSFFTKYLDPLPNSVVAISSCRSGYNNSLFDVLLAKGAGAFVGFDDYVHSGYAQKVNKQIIHSMLAGSTFGAAVDSTTMMFGAADPDLNSNRRHAKLIAQGNMNLKLATGELVNGDFENGSLTPWLKVGDGRLISQLGVTQPTGGSYMGIISTGLGYTTETGEISQLACLSDSAMRLRFDWNFFSEEFLEYCDSQYDDAFRVDLCESDDSCTTVFSTRVNSLCQNQGALSQSDISFDRGGVYDTGWQGAQVDITGFAGKKMKFRFFSTDVGDSVYDTAILLDNIRIE